MERMVRRFGSALFCVAVACVLCQGVFASEARGVAITGRSISDRLHEVEVMRAYGRFDEALAELRQMIREYSDSDEYLRRLYHETVITVFRKQKSTRDPEQFNQLQVELESEARTALSRYPDLNADPVTLPSLHELYNRLRTEMFGALIVSTTPDSCDVMIDGVHAGRTPLRIDYYPVGAHTLRVLHAGYREKTFSIDIDAARTTALRLELERIRGRRWWLTRVVAPIGGVFAAVIALVAGGNDSSQPPADSPLPGPPSPPNH